MEDNTPNKELDHLIKFVAESKREFDSQEAYNKFKTRIRPESARKNIMRRWIYAAAIVIPFLFLSYFTNEYFKLYSNMEQSVISSEVVVPNGSKVRIVLPDSTEIWLNSGSTLRYGNSFGKRSREIQLSGEAYLEVAHDKDCPFIVKTDKINIQVLGTKFNIDAYKENEEIRVALLEGSVEMRKAEEDHSVVLVPKDLALYNIASGQMKILPNCTDSATWWMTDKLIFNKDKFQQIALVLERRFDVKINIHNPSVKTLSFVGDFVNNETLEQIFDIMSTNGKFRYTIKGKEIDVY